MYKNQSLLLDTNGNSDESIEFTSGQGTNVEYSCSVIWQNRMLVYGGWGDYQYQISEVNDCSLSVIGQLPFTHLYGTCTVANEQIYLCFSQYPNETAGKLCYETSDPLDNFSALPQSKGFKYKLYCITQSTVKLLRESILRPLHKEHFQASPYSSGSFLR